MTCDGCHRGQMVPTQVPRLYAGIGIVGYTVVLGAVLTLGAGAGWGLALIRAESVELSRVLVVTPLVLIACTPLLILGAWRMFSEKKVWHCSGCDRICDRA